MQPYKNTHNSIHVKQHHQIKRKSVFYFQDRPLQLTSSLFEFQQEQEQNKQNKQHNQTNHEHQNNDLITHMPFRNTQTIMTTSKNNNKEIMICNSRPQIIQTNSNPFFANNNYMNDILAMPQMIADIKKT